MAYFRERGRPAFFLAEADGFELVLQSLGMVAAGS